MNAFQRVVWIVTLGPLFAVPWLVLSGIAALTVVALPWARVALQVAAWTAWPSADVPTSVWEQGSNLQERPEAASTTGYVVWLATAGLWLAVLHHIVAAAFGVTIVGLIATFPHLELGKVALVLNPGAFRMAPPRRPVMPWARTAASSAQPGRSNLHFP